VLSLYRDGLVVKGMRCDGCLIVPVRDTSGVIHTLEFIYRNPSDGDNKRFLHVMIGKSTTSASASQMECYVSLKAMPPARPSMKPQAIPY
jgi:hypothetical protein